jgi:hypothetical protein
VPFGRPGPGESPSRLTGSGFRPGTMSVVSTDDTAAPITLAELMPAPAPQWRPKRPRLFAAAGATAFVVMAGVAAAAWAMRPGEIAVRSLGPLKAEAARECRTAMGQEARIRADAANRSGSGAATGVVSDITVDEPRWGVTEYAWTVDGTLKFSIASILGVVPAAVDVRCTATRSASGQLVTSVVNR